MEPDAALLFWLIGLIGAILVATAISLRDRRRNGRIYELRNSLLGTKDFAMLRGQTLFSASSADEIADWYRIGRALQGDDVYDPRSGNWVRLVDLPEVSRVIADQVTARSVQVRPSQSGCLTEVLGDVFGSFVAVLFGLLVLFLVVKLVKWIWYF